MPEMRAKEIAMRGSQLRVYVFLCIMISSAIFAGKALANWQYTRWDMTPEQVVTASRGAAHTVPYDPGKSRTGRQCLVRGQYSIGDEVFDTYFCFDDQRRLKVVLLEINSPAPQQIESLKNALLTEYGQPQSRNQDSWFWTVARENNIIQFNHSALISSVSIIYKSGNADMGRGL
jgi:hypothetical protein